MSDSIEFHAGFGHHGHIYLYIPNCASEIVAGKGEVENGELSIQLYNKLPLNALKAIVEAATPEVINEGFAPIFDWNDERKAYVENATPFPKKDGWKQARIKLSLSQYDAAKALGIGLVEYSKYESGRLPVPDELEALFNETIKSQLST